MSTTHAPTMPTPESIFETLTAYQRSASLKGAIDLKLFTAIGEGNDTVATIAERIAASERGTRILCDYLTIMGFLEKNEGRYSLSKVSEMFLDQRSPAYLGTAATFLSQLHNRHFFDDVGELVRQGHNLAGEGGTVGHDDPIWVNFAHSMAPMMAMPAKFIGDVLEAERGGPWKVLDIAAGHGLFGITLAQRNPQASVWAVDWPGVLAVARENAGKRGVSERFHTIEGSAFEVQLGDGYDIVLITNFLHHFDPATCEEMLRKIRLALKPGGRVATLEFVPNEDRVSPPMAAEFSMTMLATTPKGDAYTFSEFERMFRNAGFESSELRPVPSSPESLIISS
jgi:2-polyprenyl-3-methyl-5-hydroxy-6-metoxy-1,4-benzoquinol methylase